MKESNSWIEVKMLNDALRKKIMQFRSERDWEQFHNLRTLSTSIVLEAAELAEHTQWSKDSEIQGVISARRSQIAHEVADIVILLVYLINDLGIDIEDVVEEKLRNNAERYPIERAKGSAKKYDELD